jgi:hypothetical protein
MFLLEKVFRDAVCALCLALDFLQQPFSPRRNKVKVTSTVKKTTPKTSCPSMSCP